MNIVATIRAAAAITRVIEKPSQEQIQQQQQHLKCPRCDSTKTKFCYYNNYSLSQPRHFCKACKRYWTIGGTLRNVLVGGGCRKKKKVRRSSSNPSSTNTATNSIDNSSTINESSTFSSQSLNPSGVGVGAAHLINHMLYDLPVGLFSDPKTPEVMSNDFPLSGYDNHQQQHQLSGVGLGFSSIGNLDGEHHGAHRNGFSTSKKILKDLISNSNPSSLVFTLNRSTNTSTTTIPTTLPTVSMSSFLTSSLQQQQKFNLKSLFPYESDLQVKGVNVPRNEGVYINSKDDHVMMENNDDHHGQCQIPSGYEIHDHNQQLMAASDPSVLWNNWLDPDYSNIGSSSVSPLF